MPERRHIPFCANPRSDEQRDYWREQGIEWLLAGEDRGVLQTALRKHLRALRDN